MFHILCLTCRMFLYGMFHQCCHTTNTILHNISLYTDVFSTREDISIPPFDIRDNIFLGFFWCDQCKFGCWWNACFLCCCCNLFLKFVQLCLLVKKVIIQIISQTCVWFTLSLPHKWLLSSSLSSFSRSWKPQTKAITWNTLSVLVDVQLIHKYL